MQSQKTSRRVLVPRDGRLSALGLLRCLLAECLCTPRVVPPVVIPIFSRSFGEVRPRSSPRAANLVLVEFWSNPGHSVDLDRVGLRRNASKNPAFRGAA